MTNQTPAPVNCSGVRETRGSWHQGRGFFFLSSERDLKVCWFVGATLDVSYVYCCDKQSPEVRIWIAFEEGLARAVLDVYQPVLMRATAVSMLVSSIYSLGGGGGFCHTAHQV